MEDSAVSLQRNLSKFITHVDNLQNEDDPAGNGYNREYRTLREEAQQAKTQNTYPATVGREPYNIRKNRYKDIIPYDETRVILGQIEGIEGSDYINANFIQDVHGNEGYIASQGPLPNTVTDFWRMLMEYRVKCVIMVCREMEGGKKKCAPYWPESEGEDIEFGNITVVMEKEQFLAEDCTVRRLRCTQGESTHILTQYHYTGWPDHGIPEDIDVILAMLANMREIRSNDTEKAPVVVHCSAGCGRTGTVCAIDYSWDILKNGKLREDFSLFEIVQDMRSQRQSMIQTPDQYELAHQAVKELFQKHLSVMEENIYANYGNDEDGDEQGTELAGKGLSISNDGDDDIYSMATAQKFLENEAMQAVNIYTNPEENLPVLQPKVFKPDVAKKPVMSKRTDLPPKPDLSDRYENVLVTERYENIDVREAADKTKVSNKTSDQRSSVHQSLKGSPKSDRSSKNKENNSGLVSQSASKNEGPVFASSSKSQEGPAFASSVGKQEGPVFATSTGATTQIRSELEEVIGQKKRTSPRIQPKNKQNIDSNVSNHTQNQSGPVFSNSLVQPKPKTTQPPASNSNAGKFVTKISVGGSFEQEGSSVSYHDDRQNQPTGGAGVAPAGNNDSFYSLANSQVNHESPSEGPVFSSINQGGDIYAAVNKSKPTPRNQQSAAPKMPSHKPGGNFYSEVEREETGQAYAEVKRMSYKKANPNQTSASAYEEVVLGTPTDELYSFADPNVEPTLPDRNYRESPTNTISKATTLPAESADDRGGNTFLNQATKVINVIKKGTVGGQEQPNVDTNLIPGYKIRIDKKPSGPKEQPSRWKKMFKSK